ncbi:hypothetical protein HDU85_000741 [Gaertneriomyces sp. JEL0708]|nr:hypothetical protein HDU85_000741 [Gaertneriomyces sp. JEL0708]
MGFSNGGWKRFVDWAVVALGVYTVRALRSWKGEWWSRWTEVAIVGIIFGGFNDETVSPETDVGSYILPLVRFVCLIIAFIISVWVGVLCWPVRAAWIRRGEVADVVTQIADVLRCIGGNGDEWDIKVWTIMDRLKPGAKLKEIYEVVQAIRSLVYTLIFVHTSAFTPSSPFARSSPTSQTSDSITLDTCAALSQCLDALASLLRRTINPGRPLGTAEVRAQFIVIEESCRELQGHLERLSAVEDEQKQRLVVLIEQAFAVVEASRGLVCGD